MFNEVAKFIVHPEQSQVHCFSLMFNISSHANDKELGTEMDLHTNCGVVTYVHDRVHVLAG